MNPADILDRAADLIQFTGHCQGTATTYADDGYTYASYCVLHAINAAAINASEGLLGEPARQALASFLGTDRVAHWSDTTPTDEVIDTMRRCAKALREVAA